MKNSPLIGDLFPPVGEEDWRGLATRAVGGRGLTSLVSRSEDGLDVGPIYQPARTGMPIGRSTPGPWTIVQQIDSGNPRAVADKVETDIEGGAGAIDLVFAGSPVARRRGLLATDAHSILVAIDPMTTLRIDAGEATAGVLATFAAGATHRRLSASFDPVATLVTHGGVTQPIDTLRSDFAAAAAKARGDGLNLVTFVGDGRPWHDGGATSAQELAAVLAAVVEHLRFVGKERDRDGGALGVTLAADADQFLTIAKFRALRLLLARIAEVTGRAELAWTVHAETSWRMMSLLDPTMNMPRMAVAAFAAGIGGADSVTVLPQLLDDGDAFARRMARNTQLILIDEANVARVADPAAGSGAIEALTEGLAATAWEGFRAIEAEGGLAASVRSGAIQQRIAAERERRLAAVSNRDIELVGVNAFVDGAPPLPDTATGPAEAPAGASNLAERAEPLVRERLAASSERRFPTKP